MLAVLHTADGPDTLRPGDPQPDGERLGAFTMGHRALKCNNCGVCESLQVKYLCDSCKTIRYRAVGTAVTDTHPCRRAVQASMYQIKSAGSHQFKINPCTLEIARCIWQRWEPRGSKENSPAHHHWRCYSVWRHGCGPGSDPQCLYFSDRRQS